MSIAEVLTKPQLRRVATRALLLSGLVATAGAVILYELLRRAEQDGRLPAGDRLV